MYQHPEDQERARGFIDAMPRIEEVIDQLRFGEKVGKPMRPTGKVDTQTVRIGSSADGDGQDIEVPLCQSVQIPVKHF
jgi:hypothetical protein